MTTCCGSSVGVLITDAAARLLMIERGWWPRGIAPVAGHVYDAHADAAQAAVAEVKEEVGLSVVGEPRLLWEEHRANRCASPPASPPGHYWWIYTATATGDLHPAPGETRGADWYAPAEVQTLARRTIAFARTGRPATDQPSGSLEAVWVEHLARIGLLDVAARDLDPIRRLYSTPPRVYWRGEDS